MHLQVVVVTTLVHWRNLTLLAIEDPLQSVTGRMDVPHKMAILGQMGELGEVSHEEHQKVVDQLQAAGLENVWLVGDEFKDIPCVYS